MRQVFIVTNTVLPNILLPKNCDEFVLVYRYVTEEKVKKEIKYNTCRTFIGKKEVLNLYNVKEKVQIVRAQEHKMKPYDKMLVQDEQQKYIILELVPTRAYFKLLKQIKMV